MLDDLKNKIYGQVYKAKKLLHEQIVDKQLYDEESMRLFHSGWLLGAGFLLIGVAILMGLVFQDMLAVAASIVLAITCFVIHSRKPKLSEKGLYIKDELEGLKNHLENSDPIKINELLTENPSYFEKIYPYAIALGVDKTWMKKIEEMDIPEPHWYGRHSSHPLYATTSNRGRMSDFSKNFSVPAISSVFASAPHPQGGSGGRSSGGGFGGGGAGGGFGGGGSSW